MKLELTKSGGNSWGKPVQNTILYITIEPKKGQKETEIQDILNECTKGSYWWEIVT